MSLDTDYFAPISAGWSTVLKLYGYASSTDALATIKASAYFNNVNAVEVRLRKNDIIIINGSDGFDMVAITSTTGTTPITVDSILDTVIEDATFAGALTVTGNSTLGGATNVMGNTAKTAYNKLTGHTKIDNRPTGGTSDDYALQIRSESAKTSGTHWGLDGETHLVASGTASLRGAQGVAVVDSTYTCTGGTLIGTYGQARVDGTIAGGSFMAGLYGLIEASTAITASHVCSAWLDSHQANAVTGEHELLYMTNNGAAVMDQAVYVYGGNSISSFVNFNTCGTMVADATGETMTITKKIAIVVDGVTLYLQAGTMA